MTKVWINHENDAFAVEASGGFYVGAVKVKKRPGWTEREPDYIFGQEIEWNGGQSPVAGNELVLCKLRNGAYYLGPANVHSMLWVHAPARGRPNPAGDVVAYQVEANG
jgi:hypothetical protein